MPLRNHQVEPAAHLVDVLRQHPSAVDWSDMGTGKTHVGVAVASELRLPTLCVVPKIARTGWRLAAELAGDSFSITNYEALRTGNTPFGRWEHPFTGLKKVWQCVNCQRKYPAAAPEKIDSCYCRHDGIHCFETKTIPHRYGKFIFHPGIGFIIFDEIHRCNGVDSLNAELVIAARRQNIKLLGLSATFASSPLHMRATGYALGLHKLADFYSWAARLGVRRIPGCGFKWLVSAERQKLTMAAIRAALIPARGVRVTTDSIPNFPKVHITAELYDLDEGGKIAQLYAEMAEAIAELKEHALDDKSPDHPLTKILRARQTIELLKVPLMEELRNDYISKGFSVALFINFAQTMKALRQRLKCNCIVDGSPEGVKQRDANVAAFQRNESRDIILNIEAGSACISLQDLHGGFPRIGLAMPTFSATSVRQLVGRLPRDGGKSTSYYKFLFAAGTVEAPMQRALALKLDNLDALNDSDLMPENLRFAS